MNENRVKPSANAEINGGDAKKLKRSSSLTETNVEDPKQECSGIVQYSVTFEPEFWEKIWDLEQALLAELSKINYKADKAVAAVYNPIEYAADIHKNYMRKFLKRAPSVLFLGMNPGLSGMCQTAIPFGNVPTVRNWMKILEGNIVKPDYEIPAKPIEGLHCKREEPSGKRFWGVLEELCIEPENFFRHCFVYNICPLAFLTSTGRNITPPEIKGESKSQLNSVCLKFLEKAIEIFNPKIIVSVGSYANDRIKSLKNSNCIRDTIDCKLISHPSPRAINNQDWVKKAKVWYKDNDIIKYFKP